MDQIRWKWNREGIYTARSTYSVISEGGKIRWRFSYIWSAKVPPTVKIFAYMVLNERVLTRRALNRRGIHVDLHCVCCLNCPSESILHLVFLCPFAVEVWFHIANFLKRPLFKIGASVQNVWEGYWNLVKSQGRMSKKEWTSRFICAIWNLWKNRNAIIFREQRTAAKILALRTIQEMNLWLNNV